MTLYEITATDTYPIRQKVLRPDEPLASVMIEGDRIAFHLGAQHDGVLVGVASLFEDPEDSGLRLRKVAVLPAFQNRGIGALLITGIESEAASKGAAHIWFDARVTALGFYTRLNYQAFGTEFDKGGRAYIKMRKPASRFAEPK
jgi:GNAT superfamily N-acetyltransferase